MTIQFDGLYFYIISFDSGFQSVIEMPNATFEYLSRYYLHCELRYVIEGLGKKLSTGLYNVESSHSYG